MRQMEFKMERTGLLEVGDVIPVTEYKLPNSWYYVLGKSYAMSANYPNRERLKSEAGKVIEIKETDRGYYVVVEFEE
ncbi:MAG: hypothetical protein LIO56_05310 [Lachnospiraceae bacterium]|nr:hypothetical protein [Lachnospiraceae bacterium]